MTSLNAFLKSADERVRKAAVDALNEAAEKLQHEIKTNMATVGINSRNGDLVGSIKFTKATEKRPSVKVYSEVYKAMPKRPNIRRRKWGKPDIKYARRGVPYGRILEFSPRIRKPFFYTVWYKERNKIKEEVIKAIGQAWSGK